LPSRFVANIKKSTVKILRRNVKNDTFESCGVGFFIENNKVVTCAHNFPPLNGIVNNDINKLVIEAEIHSGQVIKLSLFGFSNADDYDVAIFETEYNSAHHLKIGPPPEDDARLAITSFGIGLTNAVDRDNVMCQHFMVIQGILISISSHYIVYESNLFSGDSGGAVICASDGVVIGLHLETVNEAHDKNETRKITVVEVNESVNSLISGLSQGFVALRLDSDLIWNILNHQEQ
jgi:hypothetical protein